MFENEVRVFVDRHRIMLARYVLHHDIVAAPAPREIRDGEIVEPIGMVLLLPTECDDTHREFRHAFGRAGLQKEAADLFEVEDRFSALLFAGGGIKFEIWRG